MTIEAKIVPDTLPTHAEEGKTSAEESPAPLDHESRSLYCRKMPSLPAESYVGNGSFSQGPSLEARIGAIPSLKLSDGHESEDGVCIRGQEGANAHRISRTTRLASAYMDCITRDARRDREGKCEIKVESVFFERSFILRVVFRPFQWLASMRHGWWCVYVIDAFYLWNRLLDSDSKLGHICFNYYPDRVFEEMDADFFTVIIADCVSTVFFATLLHLSVAMSDLSLFDAVFALWKSGESPNCPISSNDFPTKNRIDRNNTHASEPGKGGRPEIDESEYPYVFELQGLLCDSRRASRGLSLFWAVFFLVIIFLYTNKILKGVLLEIDGVVTFALVPPICLSCVTGFWFIWIVPIVVRKILYLYLCEWKAIIVMAHETSRHSPDNMPRRPLQHEHLLPLMLALHSKEDDIISAINSISEKSSSYFNFFFGVFAFLIFLGLIRVLLLSKKISEDSDNFMLLFWLFSLSAVSLFFICFVVFLLIRMASVVEVFRKMSSKIFRGPPCWNLSTMLGGDPSQLQTHMEKLEPLLALRVFGVPISYDTVNSLVSTIIVGLMFISLGPLITS